MARAYATLANGGKRHKPIAIRKVKFRDGKTDDSLGQARAGRSSPTGSPTRSPKILEQNVQKGTGTKAQIGCPAAGKTGTTDNFNDAWFVGYTPHLATSVWVGYPNALREMRNVHGITVAGGTFPTQIWGAFMKQAKGSDCDDFKKPSTSPKWSPFHGKNARTGKPRRATTTATGGWRRRGRRRPRAAAATAATTRACTRTAPRPRQSPGGGRGGGGGGGGNNGGGDGGGGDGGGDDGGGGSDSGGGDTGVGGTGGDAGGTGAE